ncbi:MAG: M3 family metallopeptidase [Gammaproteobacteria bacterium]
MNNPLLEQLRLPHFSKIQPQHIIPAVEQILTENRAEVENILKQKEPFTWQNLMQPLEELEDHLNSTWAIINHLNAVANSKDIREAYHACLPKISEYSTEMAHNKKLYNAVKSLADGPEYAKLDPVQQKIIRDELRDFHLAGVDLPPEDKRRFSYYQKRLSKLMSQFEDNLLDATQGWSHLVTNEQELAGLPKRVVNFAHELAKQKNLNGWQFTLDPPSFIAVMTHADSRELRKEIYTAYVTRASEQGPNANRWDNSKVMEDILKVRQEIAKMLQFNNYAEVSLVTKSASSSQKVLDFLHELARHALPRARREFAELSHFAKKNYGIEHLEAWDIAYFSEKLRQHKFTISEEQLRVYFPEQQVLNGLFAIIQRLFGMSVKEVPNAEVWDKDVRFFEIYDSQNILRGQFYLDLYARPNKRGGAWMDECRTHRRLPNGEIQNALVFITCNFSRPVKSDPSLLSHEEVLTLFHEFGHALHHILTQIDYADASGGSGVPWDVIEFPSQFMENWGWEKTALDLITRHYQTGEIFPTELFDRLRAVEYFQAGLQMMRQLEFGLFDFRLHLEYDEAKKNQIQQILDEVRTQYSVLPVPSFNRFQDSFAHIFGSNAYAAGYYSYKWAEVMSSDAFAKFEEKGVFDRKTGDEFLHTILEKGGSEDPIKLFIAFRGREPRIDALLRHMGQFTTKVGEDQEHT